MEALCAGDPTELGPFELFGRLDSGELGVVFLGQHADGPLSAVTVLHPRHAVDARLRAQLLQDLAQERAIQTRLAAAITQVDLEGPVPWVAREYIPGPSLRKAVADAGPLPEPMTGVLAVRLTDALLELHRLGRAHHGLAPSGVILGAVGPRLTDLGQHRASLGSTHTLVGPAVGTPAFLAPEQALGDHAGTAADVFALASVVVFACTGRGPFGLDEPPLRVLRRVIDAHPDLSGVPSGLARVLQECLVRHPGARPTAEQLRAHLESWDDVWMSDAWPGSRHTTWLRGL